MARMSVWHLVPDAGVFTYQAAPGKKGVRCWPHEARKRRRWCWAAFGAFDASTAIASGYGSTSAGVLAQCVQTQLPGVGLVFTGWPRFHFRCPCPRYVPGGAECSREIRRPLRSASRIALFDHACAERLDPLACSAKLKQRLEEMGVVGVGEIQSRPITN